MMNAPLDHASAAYCALAETEANLATERDILTRIEHDLERARIERARLIELQDEAAAELLLNDAEALLSGDSGDRPMVNPKRSKRIATLGDRVPALAAAIGLQRQKIAEAEQLVAAAKAPFAGKMIDAATDMQGPAIARAQEALADLGTALGQLLAVDMIMAGTLGDRFPVPVGKTPPPRFQSVVAKIIEAVPPRLRPAGFAVETLQLAAGKTSGAALAQIKGSTKL